MAKQNLDELAYKKVDEKTSDDELLRVANAWYEESASYHNELDKKWKQNENYYKGKQTDVDRIPADMSDAVQNHIFMGTETVVPIITANPPQFLVEPAEYSDVSIRYANKVQQVLGVHYETKDVRTQGEMLMRHMVIYRFGCWKPFWDETINDVNVKYVRPKRLYFPKVPSGLPYIIEKIDMTADEIREAWGENMLKKIVEDKGGKYDNEHPERVSGIYTLAEYHTPDLVFYKSSLDKGGFIIEKKQNPDYNFNGKNHFDEPKLPYIICSAFRLGNEPVGETDLIQQTIPIQDVINVSNRLIINNATKTGNAQWFVDSEVMSEEEARNKITNSPGIIIYGSGVANQNMLRRDPPPLLPNYIPELKIMAENAFDNIFGTHSTTRGERGQTETLGGRILLKQGDLGRIDLLVREYERCVGELGNWFVQLMRMHYTKKRTFKVSGTTGSKMVDLMPRDIEDGIKILVKSGTTLPTDELSKRQEAIQLWSMGALDPVTLYERLKFPNPEEAAEKLQAWRQGDLMMQAKAKQAGGNLEPQATGRSVKAMPSGKGEVAKGKKSIQEAI